MQNKVRVKKAQLDRFRKLSRNSPNELQAFLIGTVVSPTLTVIDSFEYCKEYAVSTPQAVSWYVHEYAEVVRKAEDKGKRIVGFIHSHPEWDAVVSLPDYQFTILNGYRICGICSTEGRKTRPRFWVMDSALECAIEYAKRRSKPKAKSESEAETEEVTS